VLSEFRKAVCSSRAVVCRSVSKLKDLVSSDNELYASFYQLVASGARRPEPTRIDRQRLLADDLLFPYYRDQIRFAALSLDGRGVTSYGDCSLTLRDVAIQDRSTVFEENSLTFSSHTQSSIGDSIPPGYRATWEQRDVLAAAKLGSRLDPMMEEFADLMISPGSAGAGDDFIEVHIYGPLHRHSLSQVIARPPIRKADLTILREVRRLLEQAGILMIIEALP
jgi:hypothetical protein